MDDKVIKAGSVLLTCKPFAFSLLPKFKDTRCDQCLSPGIEYKLSRCGGCQMVKYCDRICQKDGWNSGHKYECTAIKNRGQVPNSFSRMLLRIIVKLQTPGDLFDIINTKMRRRFRDLMSHYTDVKNDKWRMEQIYTMGKVVESILKYQNPKNHPQIIMPNESELIGICGRIFVNTFNILDDELVPVGSGLYLGASIFDHSCEPTAFAFFQSTTIYIRNIEDLPANFPIDKITISYQDILRPSFIRIPDLRSAYYFDCECVRCKDKRFDGEMSKIHCPFCNHENVNLEQSKKCSKCKKSMDEEYVKKIEEINELCITKLQEMTNISYLDVCKTCLSLLSSMKYSKFHWLNVSLSNSAFEAAIDLNKWEYAYNYAIFTLPGQRKYLNKMNPLLGILLLKLAKLSWYLEKESDAKKYIIEAKEILTISVGIHSTLFNEKLMPLYNEILNYIKAK